MGILDSIFGKTPSQEQRQPDFHWKPLVDTAQLEQIKQESLSKKIVIFKHSTRCGISNMALKGFTKKHADIDTALVSFYYLDLLAYRVVSNAVADVFSVFHQSPQVLVIENGVVTKDASHGAIDQIDL